MKRIKICLACSPGGHWHQLQLAVGDIPKDYNCYWLTFKVKSTEVALKNTEHLFLVDFQTSKKWTMVINFIQSLFWIVVKRPNVVITTGAGVAVPTIFLAKRLLNAKIIYIVSAANVTECSKTPLWAEKYSDEFYIQWEELKEIFPNAVNIGVL